MLFSKMLSSFVSSYKTHFFKEGRVYRLCSKETIEGVAFSPRITPETSVLPSQSSVVFVTASSDITGACGCHVHQITWVYEIATFRLPSVGPVTWSHIMVLFFPVPFSSVDYYSIIINLDYLVG